MGPLERDELAIAADSQGSDRVREFFARVRNGDAGVADLYAADALLTYPGGGRIQGREAIRRFYEQTIATVHPQPQVEAILEAPPFYVAILDVSTTEGRRRVLDLFELDDGGIRRLEVFAQS